MTLRPGGISEPIPATSSTEGMLAVATLLQRTATLAHVGKAADLRGRRPGADDDHRDLDISCGALLDP